MHTQVRQFCDSLKQKYPSFFIGSLALDVGSMDINGNNRYLFQGGQYIGLDIAAGNNVDVVSKGHEYSHPEGKKFDVVLSTSALEHDMHYEKTIPHMYELLREGGLMFFSVQTTDCPEHGTRRTDPNLSPNTVANSEEWSNYYKNLTEEDVRKVLDVDALFESYGFSLDGEPSNDLFFWGIKKQTDAVLEKKVVPYATYPNKKLVSIVVPTWNHWEDLLKECIDSIRTSTTALLFKQLEIIVVANGCTDNTRPYMEELIANDKDEVYKLLWYDEQIGFTRASNEGAKSAIGKYVMFLNNDVVFLPWGKPNEWIRRQLLAFDDPKVGVAGPLAIYDNLSDHKFVVGFCLLTPKALLEKYNYFDEVYVPAGGEDVDYCIRLQNDGYTVVQTANTHYDGNTNVSDFPIWHKDNKSYGSIPEYRRQVCTRNGLLNLRKYNRHAKFNFGCGNEVLDGYIPVDLYDIHATLFMDVQKPMPDVPDDCADEIVASHLFEHLNPYTIVETLKEWKRILNPGGKLTMEMPHFIKLCEWVLDAYRLPEKKQDMFGNIAMVYGANDTETREQSIKITAPHLWGWFPENVTEALTKAGFVNISCTDNTKFPHHFGPNFRVEAFKPGGEVRPAEKLPEIKLDGELEGYEVTACIPTKGRFFTTLPQCISAIVNQTTPPSKILVIDDGEQNEKKIKDDPVWQGLFRLMELKGISCWIQWGRKKGMADIDQLMLEVCKTPLIWRLDDDNLPEPNVLEALVRKLKEDDEVGAVASTAIVPTNTCKVWHKVSSGDIRDIYFSPNTQWDSFEGEREVDHLHNTYLFRRKLSGHGYDLSLSPVGHREETMFTWGIKQQGYKLIVIGDVKTWHLRQESGGIRSYEVDQNMRHDEEIFKRYMQKYKVQFRETKTIILDNGLGDHYAFKHILHDLKQRYGRIILSTCYPEVFRDEETITQISIQDAKDMGMKLEEHNVYEWMRNKDFKQNLVEAFRRMWL